MFLKNIWYMTGWSHDFEIGKITKKRLIGEDLIFYRQIDGTLVAMEDKCCHRLAPLSSGQIEGNDIRCMYHGLKFSADGQCNEIPQQPEAVISKKICVRTFPLVERHGGAWIWMGDKEKANPDTIPNFKGPDTPEFPMIADRKYINTNYMFMNDNLLDLSHVAYVHKDSFGKGDDESNRAFAELAPKTTILENGVRVERWAKGKAAIPPYMAELLPEGEYEHYSWYDFVAPGFFLLNTRTYPAGYIDKYGDDLVNQESVFSEYSCQAVTPIDEDNICYYFALGADSRFSQLKQMYNELGHLAFGEDSLMLEAQYKIVKKNPDQKLMNLAMDAPVANFRAMMDKMYKSETTPSFNA